jgi:UDP-glucose 4-epimerase
LARCLVTGGAGFIGSALVRGLTAAGHAVCVFDNLSSGKEQNLRGISPAPELLRGDVRDAESLGRAMRDVEIVFHEAAIASVPRSIAEPLENHEVNVTGTLQVLLAAKRAGVRRLVYAASAAVYGDSQALPLAESEPARPLSPYGATKYFGEIYTQQFARVYGLETIALRYFNVYGPRQDPSSPYSGVLSRFMEAYFRRGAPIIFGDGKQTRDFVFVDDVVQANLLAASAPSAATGRSYNIGTGTRVSLLDVISALNAAFDFHPLPRFESARAGDVRHSQADISLAASRLGYGPKVSLMDGIALTVQWLRAEAQTPGSGI